VSGDGPLLDEYGRFSDLVIAVSVMEVLPKLLRLNKSQNLQSPVPGANDQIPGIYIPSANDQMPSDSRHIQRVNDLIPDVNRDQQRNGYHNQPMLSDQSSPPVQENHRNVDRSSQEEDAAFIGIGGTSDHHRGAVVSPRVDQNPPAVLGEYLIEQSNQASSTIKDEHPVSKHCTDFKSPFHAMPEDPSRMLNRPSSLEERENNRESRMGTRQAGLQQTVLSPEVSGGLVQHIESGANERLSKMVSIIDDCFLA
jgi:hypothetical protein